MSDEKNQPGQGMLSGAEGFREVKPGIYILPAQGNALAIETDEGLVVIDSGPGGKASRRMIENVRSVTDKPVTMICYSHGHLGYNDGVDEWLAHNAERDEQPARLIAHENLVTRYHRYRQTKGLQSILADMQFPGAKLRFTIRDPDLVFSERLSLPVKGRRVELLWVPSETDDCIAAWLPDDGVLYSGAAFPGTTIPNIGTPLRTQRFTIRWAESCELMASFDAELLVQEFGPVIEGKQAVKDRLMKTAESLRWLRDEVVRRMNTGMNEREILEDMRYPDYFNELEYMKARYGAPEYIVRDIYREENGWWDRNPTTLHPEALNAAGDAVLSAIGDPEAVIARAEELRDAGDIQLALHVIDLVANAGSVNDVVLKARTLKAELCRQRAKEIRPYVSKALFESSARLLEKGKVSWKKPD
ncbi:MAG: alkyl sulfatase BDS1-like metallo-beta-lactamase superfamily hydrolase [Planctomycetaceae bacterium]|jgi:alkyl sulfatase BDS1-like metallo-beta-lactamase superfamily hydrolase